MNPFAKRRAALAAALDVPALFFAGLPRARNYPANAYPFRAESHFLYFAGAGAPGAALLVERGRSTLLLPRPEKDHALWHGEPPSLEAARAASGAHDVRFTDELAEHVRGREVATLPANDAATAAWQSSLLGRALEPGGGARVAGADARLADAVIALRLRQDDAALAEIRAAIAITERAHRAAARATRPGVREAAPRAAFEAELTLAGVAPAYGSIVTVHGEVLHMETSAGSIAAGDLLLVDAGAESPGGFASDVTRVYPATGRFSPTQRAIYDVVLAANRAAVALVRPGARYRDVHRAAARATVEGLRALGVFTGDVDGLLERGADAIFFPHGVGHLLGLDVHDMEDLGDRAGYAPGRVRSARFGESYLRLDRDLEPGVAFTIEPGFYQVPAILSDDALVGPLGADLRRGVLAKYADVRGVRLEDDVLCTASGAEVMTRAIPIDATEVERWMAG